MTDAQRDLSYDWLPSVLQCHAGLENDDRNEIVLQLFQHARLFCGDSASGGSAEGLDGEPIVAVSSELGSAAYFLRYPGRLASLSAIRPFEGDYLSAQALQDAAGLLRSLISDHCGGIDLFQSVLFPALMDEAELDWHRRCYAAAGLEQLAALGQFELEIRPDAKGEDLLCASSSPVEPSLGVARCEPIRIACEPIKVSVPGGGELQLIAWDETLLERLCDVVERTYQGTLDVPRLEGYRNVLDTLKSYRGTSPSAEPMWWIVTSDDLGAIDCGCLLVTRHSQTTAELIYLGVGPEYRGRGFGKALLEDLKARMADLGICRLLLAVDLDNLPAIKIYESVGFVQLGVAEVWFKPMGEVSG